MSEQVNLNELRDKILANQKRNEETPAEKDKKIMVTKEGKIMENNGNGKGKQKQLSEVHQGVFAFSRLREEKRIVRKKFPSNTKLIDIGDFHAWHYSFRDEFNMEYEMCAYFDGTAYQVKVISPEVEGKYQSIHDCHLYSDGRICFGDAYAGGLPSLENAFAKSVLWANGFTVYENTKKYPFSTNNL